MKKLIPVLTGAIMLLSLAACGSRTAAPEATTAPAAAGGKTLVVYFSATSSTKTAAEAIAAATGGDLLELEPAEPYTSADLDYNNADSRVSREHDDETLRDVALKTTTADNWADYDTVYIGFRKEQCHQRAKGRYKEGKAHDRAVSLPHAQRDQEQIDVAQVQRQLIKNAEAIWIVRTDIRCVHGQRELVAGKQREIKKANADQIPGAPCFRFSAQQQEYWKKLGDMTACPSK